MTCDRRQWSERIIDRLARELSEEETILLEQHLAECPACAAEVDFLARTVRAAAPRREWCARPSFESHLRERAHTELQRRAVRPRWTDRTLAALAAFARRPFPAYATVPLLVLALAGGVWLGRGTGHGTGFAPGGLAPSAISAPASPAPRSAFAPARIRPAVQRFEVTPSDAIALATAVEHDSL